MEKFYLNVKKLVERSGKTYRELSEETGLGVASWHSYVNGHSDPKTSIVIKIADYFKVTVDDLIRGDV